MPREPAVLLLAESDGRPGEGGAWGVTVTHGGGEAAHALWRPRVTCWVFERRVGMRMYVRVDVRIKSVSLFYHKWHPLQILFCTFFSLTGQFVTLAIYWASL